MAGIVGPPDYDSYLHSQMQPIPDSSFHHVLYFMHSWEWNLADIKYRLFMICDELQAFKICGGGELACHRLSRWAETGIHILSLPALSMEIRLLSILRYQFVAAEIYKLVNV